MMAETPIRSARIHTANVPRNCSSTDRASSARWTGISSHSRAAAQPRTPPPITVPAITGTSVQPITASPSAAPTAMR